MRASRYIKFIALSVFIYFILMISWPITKPAYSPLFIGLGTLMNNVAGFGDFLELKSVRLPTKFESFDAVINVRAGPAGDHEVSARVPINLRDFVLSPMALFVAICVASPISWRNKGRILLLGSLPLCLFIAARISFLVVAVLVKEGSIQAIGLHPFWGMVLLDVFDLGAPDEGTLRGFRVWTTLLFEQSLASCLFPTVLWGVLVAQTQRRN